MVTLDFKPDADDHIAAARLYDRSSGWALGDRVVAIVLLLVGAGSTIAVGPRWWTLIWFALGALEWFHVLNVIPFATKFWFARDPKYRADYHLEFDDAGIRFRTASIDSTIAWTHYTRTLEDPRVWLLVYGSRLYTVLPKRAFTPESEDEFRALLARHLPRRDV